MKDYVSTEWQDIAKENGLDTFAALWDHESELVEELNVRRGGTSGVSRLQFTDYLGKVRVFYLKKHANHLYKTFRHPLRGETTLSREVVNFQRCKKLGITVPHLVYYGERWSKSEVQAMMVTEALYDYYSLDDWVERWKNVPPRAVLLSRVIETIAEVLQKFHSGGLQCRCLLQKHIFLKIESATEEVDIGLLDLELAQRQLPSRARIRDLHTLHRKSPWWTVKDRIRFCRTYFGSSQLEKKGKKLWYQVQQRVKKKLIERKHKLIKRGIVEND